MYLPIDHYCCKLKFREQVNVNRKSYPIPHSIKEAVREAISKMLENDIIEYSQSQYTNPIVAIQNKSGKIQTCLDTHE